MDTNKTIQQHLELEDFLAGFMVKTEPAGTAEDSTAQDKNAVGVEALADQIRECHRCRLSGTRTQAVPGEGPSKARIMFVGEAPGEDEDAQGRPFVGKAGQYLDRILAGCGLHRQDVFIANTLKCRPPGNADPRPEEIVQCLPFLRQQIESIRPRIIVALGAHAARTLLNTNLPIGQIRGHLHEYTLSDQTKVKVMPTFHPAYLLRNYTVENRQKVWQDMQVVLMELGLPIPVRSDR